MRVEMWWLSGSTPDDFPNVLGSYRRLPSLQHLAFSEVDWRLSSRDKGRNKASQDYKNVRELCYWPVVFQSSTDSGSTVFEVPMSVSVATVPDIADVVIRELSVVVEVSARTEMFVVVEIFLVVELIDGVEDADVVIGSDTVSFANSLELVTAWTLAEKWRDSDGVSPRWSADGSPSSKKHCYFRNVYIYGTLVQKGRDYT